MAAKLASSAPAPTNRERIWAAIREYGLEGAEFTSLDLALKTRLTRRGGAVGDYLAGLERAGFIRLVAERKRGTSNRYVLARDTGVAAPRVNKAGGILPASGRTRMWKAMRILKTFSARELVNAASIEGAPIAEAEAEYYCKWLCRGGYLHGGGRKWTFVPAMNTGPKAPQILRVKKLYDPNRDAVVCEGSAQGRDDL